eukprot:TRINITY_DN9835_c0_g2_i4.p1 TRINITY_DN9835_c0_g2~~TRINITY_DN9835_c0_g2_i4.p1  ORF type:complete len:100 (+),score=12.14 TRINITY_DN9835_c0_g2_i4:3-302(+)
MNNSKKSCHVSVRMHLPTTDSSPPFSESLCFQKKEEEEEEEEKIKNHRKCLHQVLPEVLPAASKCLISSTSSDATKKKDVFTLGLSYFLTVFPDSSRSL